MNDKLDQQLKQWAADTAPTSEELAQLRRSIAERAARSGPTADHLRHQPAAAPLSIKLFYSLAGAAAALLAVCALWMRNGADPILPARDSLAKAEVAPELGVELGRRLFDEMNRMFPERLRWIAESNGDMGMGIESAPDSVAEVGAPMLMRLAVEARQDGEQDWRPAWSADVLVRSEDAIEIVPSRHADNRLSLWIYPLDDGHILVDSRIELETPLRLSAETDAVLRPGRPARLATVRRNDTDYRVYQTVWALTPESGI